MSFERGQVAQLGFRQPIPTAESPARQDDRVPTRTGVDRPVKTAKIILPAVGRTLVHHGHRSLRARNEYLLRWASHSFANREGPNQLIWVLQCVDSHLHRPFTTDLVWGAAWVQCPVELPLHWQFHQVGSIAFEGIWIQQAGIHEQDPGVHQN